MPTLVQHVGLVLACGLLTLGVIGLLVLSDHRRVRRESSAHDVA